MDDTISRQDAINALNKLDVSDGVGISSVACALQEEAIRSIENLPTAELQWIMCSERLPEEDGQYLITVKYKHVNGYEGVYAEHGDWFDGEWDMYYCSGHCGEVEDIIAWMPLPEPCNAESEV